MKMKMDNYKDYLDKIEKFNRGMQELSEAYSTVGQELKEGSIKRCVYNIKVANIFNKAVKIQQMMGFTRYLDRGQLAVLSEETFLQMSKGSEDSPYIIAHKWVEKADMYLDLSELEL